MLRLLCASALFLGAPTIARAQDSGKPGPIAAKRVQTTAAESTLALAAASIAKQSGIDFDLTAVDGAAKVGPIPATDFWLAAEALAAQTGARLVPTGGMVKLVKGTAAPSSVDGPFRVSVKQVTAKRDFDTGESVCDVQLEVAWEPRFPVYMLDNIPKIEVAKTGAEAFKVGASTGRVPTTGFSQSATVRVQGIPRSAPTLDILSGTFRVVAAEKLLAVEFKELTAVKPASQTLDGVKVTLKPVKRLTGAVQFDFDLEYPAGHPEFESFELWASANKLKLYAPDNRTAFEPIDFSTDESGRRIAASYSFPSPAGKPLPDLKGWRAVYETPGPMLVQTVKFELKGIALP
jgi:hypothetical protein